MYVDVHVQYMCMYIILYYSMYVHMCEFSYNYMCMYICSVPVLLQYSYSTVHCTLELGAML